MKLAKRVFSFDLGRVIDRTKETHDLGTFDVDFRDRNAWNPKAREWTYAASYKTLGSALRGAETLRTSLQHLHDVGFTVETRIVNAETGEVMRQ